MWLDRNATDREAAEEVHLVDFGKEKNTSDMQLLKKKWQKKTILTREAEKRAIN